jgi:hypothetical protein
MQDVADQDSLQAAEQRQVCNAGLFSGLVALARAACPHTHPFKHAGVDAGRLQHIHGTERDSKVGHCDSNGSHVTAM